MHVLLVNILFQGGQTTHTIELAVGLKRKGVKVSFMLIGEKAYPRLAKEFRKIMAENGIPVFTRSDAKTLLPNVDIVHAHSSWTYALAVRWKEIYGVPVVFTIHGLGIRADQRLKKANALIAVGRRTKEGLPDELQEKTVLITNGVDLEKYKPPPDKAPSKPLIVLYAGRLTEKKVPGLEALAAAVQKAGLLLLVASDREVPLGRNAVFVGWQEELLPIMQQVDVLFACGRTIREGMALGLACGVLGENYYGLITTAEVSPENLDLSGITGDVPSRDAILKDLLLLKKPKFFKKCRSVARSLVERFYSLDQMVERTLEVYSKVLAG